MDNEHDNVRHPAHYETGKFECIEIMEEVFGIDAVKSFCLCNAFKYLYRTNRKNGREDLEKADWYIQRWLMLDDKQKAGNYYVEAEYDSRASTIREEDVQCEEKE